MSRSKALGAPSAPKVLGGKLPRIDGPLKVSGRATYTSDVSFPGMLYAVPVRSTIASGRVVAIDDRVARKMLGVRAIYYRGNMRPFFVLARDAGRRITPPLKSTSSHVRFRISFRRHPE